MKPAINADLVAEAVVDASVMVETLLRTPAGMAIEDRLLKPWVVLHAPHLIDVEVAHAMRRCVAEGDIPAQRCRAALADLEKARLQRYPHSVLWPRIWDLRHSLSAYDAAYVALAEVLDAVLLTCDRRLAASVGHQARIELL